MTNPLLAFDTDNATMGSEGEGEVTSRSAMLCRFRTQRLFSALKAMVQRQVFSLMARQGAKLRRCRGVRPSLGRAAR